MILGFLQNAWSPLYAGIEWPRDSWLRALHRSRSGQRIAVMTKVTVGSEWWFDNTTPICGDEPNSVVPPDVEHIRRVVDSVNPSAIVLMGKQALKSVRPICEDIPLLAIPHPAFRLLKNELYIRAGELLRDGFEGEIELRQGRESVLELQGIQ